MGRARLGPGWAGTGPGEISILSAPGLVPRHHDFLLPHAQVKGAFGVARQCRVVRGLVRLSRMLG